MTGWPCKYSTKSVVAGCRVVVCELLEKNANAVDRKAGLDIADYLLKLEDSSGLAMTDGPYPVILIIKLKIIKMHYTRIRQALSLPHALARYNKRFDSNFHQQHIRVLLILRGFDYWPSNRAEILTILEKRSLSVNYTQLDKVLSLLLKELMITENKCRGNKAYCLAPAGIQLLYTLERWIRKMRFDKINHGG